LDNKVDMIKSIPSFIKPIPVMAKSMNLGLNLEPKGPFELRLANPLPPPIFTKHEEPPAIQPPANSDEDNAAKLTPITNCKHTHLKHFAKGMCNHCYHRFGRTALSDKCPHTDR